MLGELAPQQIENVLLGETLGRIGCHSEGRTYVVPVTYAYDGESVICHSGEGEKIRMMRTNPQVCFEVEQVDNLANWRSVIAWGTFEELKEDQAAVALGLLVSRLLPEMSSATMPSHGVGSVTPHGSDGSPAIVFRIRLQEKTGRFERR